MSSPHRQNEDRHSRFELRTILETSRLLIESRDMDFVLNNLLLITMGKLLVTKGMVLIAREDSDSYCVSKVKGRTSHREGDTLSLGLDPSLKQQPVVECSAEGVKIPALFGGEAPCMLFNLRTSNEHIGYLCLGPKGGRTSYTRQEIEFVESLAIISSVAIANSRMFSELRRTNRMLDRKVYELNNLFELSKDFNMMVDREEIVRVFKFAMLGQMLIRKFFFILEHEGRRKVVGTSGIKRNPHKKEISRMFSLEDDLIEVTPQLEEEIPFLRDEQIEAVIGLKFQGEKIGLVGVGARANDQEYSESDYNFLRSLGNLALLSIQKTFLLEERIDKERMEEELTIAKGIQRGLLPDPLPDCEGLQISATNISSSQVGGDYFDVLETPDGNMLFAIGDVTGKGMPAALLMANLQAMLHLLLPIDITLSDATGRVNDIIYENTPSDKFITFFWSIYNPESRSLRYVNAGHNPPMLFRKDSDAAEELDEGGLILGAMPTMAPYDEQSIILNPGDLLVFYTDGVNEAVSPDGTEEYGMERLLDCIRSHRGAPSHKIMEAIVEDVNAFSGGNQSDDITLIVVRAD